MTASPSLDGLPATTDVLVVGAGPTGLALATALRRAGVDCVVVDRLAQGQDTSRAAVIHAHTLEVLESIGVADALVRDGLTLTRFSLRDRDRVLAELRFDTLPTKYASLLMLPQERTELHLAAALAAAGGSVHRSCTVQTVVAAPAGAIATLATSHGLRTVAARFVVGADGMHSVVRSAAGIGFGGVGYEDSFVLADVDMTWPAGRDEVMLFFSPAGLLVVAPLPGDRFRIVATLDDAPREPASADVQALLDARGPTRARALVHAVHWSSRFRLHHRVADRFRRGPFFVIGDAAHVHSPAGGQGMNTGLVDACVLGELLADVLVRGAPATRLDVYDALRRPAAEQVLRLADRLTRMAVLRSAPRRYLRNVALQLAAHVPMFRRRLARNLSGLSRRAAARLPPL